MWIATFDMPHEFSFLVEDNLCLHSKLISQTQFDCVRGIKQLMLTILSLLVKLNVIVAEELKIKVKNKVENNLNY
jgi:hypothetical protein